MLPRRWPEPVGRVRGPSWVDHQSQSVETRYGWVVLGASVALMSIGFGGLYVIIIALKPIAAEFDWPRTIPSLANALSWAGAGFGGIAFGLWADRRGIFYPILVASFGIGAGLVASGLATGMTSLFLAQGLLLGLCGNGATFSPLMANATRWFDRRRGVAVAIVASGQSLAGGVWPPIFQWGIENYGWRETMIAYGVFVTSAMVPLSLLLRRPAPKPSVVSPEAPNHRSADGRVLGLPANLVQGLLGLAILGCCIAMAMPMVHIVAYCTDLGFSAARGAEMLSVLLACGFASRLAYGMLADRIGGLKTLLIGVSGQALMLSTYAWVESQFGLYVVSALFGLAFGGIVPSYAIVVRELFAVREAGWRIGTVYLFGTSGMAVGGLLGGVIFDAVGHYQAAFLVGVAANLATLALVSALVWREGDADPRAVPGVA